MFITVSLINVLRINYLLGIGNSVTTLVTIINI